MSVEFQYFILFSFLLILPKGLLRYGIPGPLTALALGMLTNFFLGWFQGDQLILMLSRLGITSLFLFAGMEVNLGELQKDARALSKHLATAVLMVFLVGWCLQKLLVIKYRPALLLSLGLMTPSTGFILNSLRIFDFTSEQDYWIRSKAISKEIVAIGMMFFILQTESLNQFLISMGLLIGLIFLLPVLFKFFLKVIVPFAPDSEGIFLILIALLAGVITMKIGTYYLVGAFIVGMIAGRFRTYVDRKKTHQIMTTVSFFFAFFVPFYFYSAGLKFTRDIFTWSGLLNGILLILVFIPLRTLSVWSSLYFFMKEHWKDRYEISISLLPTLIFGLVIATILQDRYLISSDIVSGLIIYTLCSSIVPAMILKKAIPQEYDVSLVSSNTESN